MTLADVVRGCREEIAARLKKDYPTLSGSEVLDVIEADPDFKLRDRVEDLIRQWERFSGYWPEFDHAFAAGRLRVVLEGKS